MQSSWEWRKVPVELADRLPTPEQKQIFGMMQSGMTQPQMASERGISLRNTVSAISRIKKNLRAAGYDPENHMTLVSPEPQAIKGRTALVKVGTDGTETVAMYWNKTEKSRQETGLEMLADKLAAQIAPYKPSKQIKTKHITELMAAIFIGDAHIGMYAYQPETRHSDFNVDLATAQLREAIDNLIDRSPACEIGLLCDVGDFMHADTSHNKTFSGTDLDVDTRYERILDMAALVMRYAIDRMLSKFKRIIVVVVKGNHNPNAAVAVQKIISAFYHADNRVEILRTASYFHYIEWGKWLIGFNHGDKIKATKLPGIMARDQSEAWGRTTSRMWALGHFHHQNVLELDGCVVQKFAALPPPDGWHSSMGYSSIQAMQMIIFKKQGGKHSTLIYELDRQTQQPDLRIK